MICETSKPPGDGNSLRCLDMASLVSPATKVGQCKRFSVPPLHIYLTKLIWVWAWLCETLGVESVLGLERQLWGLSAHCSSTGSKFGSQNSHQAAAHRCLYLSLPEGIQSLLLALPLWLPVYMLVRTHTQIKIKNLKVLKKKLTLKRGESQCYEGGGKDMSITWWRSLKQEISARLQCEHCLRWGLSYTEKSLHNKQTNTHTHTHTNVFSSNQ